MVELGLLKAPNSLLVNLNIKLKYLVLASIAQITASQLSFTNLHLFSYSTETSLISSATR